MSNTIDQDEQTGVDAIIYVRSLTGKQVSRDEAIGIWRRMPPEKKKLWLETYSVLKPEHSSQNICPTCGSPLDACSACGFCESGATA